MRVSFFFLCTGPKRLGLSGPFNPWPRATEYNKMVAMHGITQLGLFLGLPLTLR